MIPETTIYNEKMELDSARDTSVSSDIPNTRREKDINVPDGTQVETNLVSEGNLRVGNNCHIFGTLKASGKTEIGEATTIDGSVLSMGSIVVGQNCKIGGVIISTEDIVLNDNVVAEAVTTEKVVKLGNGVRINKRISGVAIVSYSESRLNGEGKGNK